jgi:pimeloyl-ACP methyl ester carboxylesterase
LVREIQAGDLADARRVALTWRRHTRGRGMPVVLVHGLTFDRRIW